MSQQITNPPLLSPVYVTQPLLPPLEEFIPYLEEIWESKILTNGGPLHQRLEQALAEYLEVPYVSLFNNGTIALVVALQALELNGEVITTPYSFLATTNAIVWNRLTPVFVDVDPQTLNLDPGQIEAAITDRTTAILPVHCYGFACDTEAIESIAQKHSLKVVYDAAHAFGVRCHCGSLLQHGDLSVLSFHATKIFNTFEGGAVISHSPEMKQRIDRLKNFGYAGETQTMAIGLNGKLSEVQAAMGLAQLPYIESSRLDRQRLDQLYRKQLVGVPGIRCLVPPLQQTSNYSYFPILVEDDYPLTRDQLQQILKEIGVVARRYFYPALPHLLQPHLAGATRATEATDWPIANDSAARVLCLPIYADLEPAIVNEVCRVIRQTVAV